MPSLGLMLLDNLALDQECVFEKGSLLSKSLERSPAVGDFYGTRIEIWAGFGPVRQLLRPVFSCFHGQKDRF